MRAAGEGKKGGGRGQRGKLVDSMWVGGCGCGCILAGKLVILFSWLEESDAEAELRHTAHIHGTGTQTRHAAQGHSY